MNQTIENPTGSLIGKRVTTHSGSDLGVVTKVYECTIEVTKYVMGIRSLPIRHESSLNEISEITDGVIRLANPRGFFDRDMYCREDGDEDSSYSNRYIVL